MRRNDQQAKTYFRSERLFTMNDQWYFASREGDQGPFPTREAAQAALKQFTSECVALSDFQASRDRDSEPVETTIVTRVFSTPGNPRLRTRGGSELLI